MEMRTSRAVEDIFDVLADVLFRSVINASTDGKAAFTSSANSVLFIVAQVTQ
jgi:hypothetical protein